MAGEIFVSYRRADTGGTAGRIADRLKSRFGEDAVFFDTADMGGGVVFPQRLRRGLEDALLVLVLIGSQWESLTLPNQSRPRLFDEQDWVRQEVESALQGSKRLVPVLVNRNTMPTVNALPPALWALCNRQSEDISDQRFERDIAYLIQVIEGMGLFDLPDDVNDDAMLPPVPPNLNYSPIPFSLVGTWDVQIQSTAGSAQGRFMFLPTGAFQAQIASMTGQIQVMGQWTMQGNVLQVQGVQGNGYQQAPYYSFIQLNTFDNARLLGISGVGERISAMRVG